MTTPTTTHSPTTASGHTASPAPAPVNPTRQNWARDHLFTLGLVAVTALYMFILFTKVGFSTVAEYDNLLAGVVSVFSIAYMIYPIALTIKRRQQTLLRLMIAFGSIFVSIALLIFVVRIAGMTGFAQGAAGLGFVIPIVAILFHAGAAYLLTLFPKKGTKEDLDKVNATLPGLRDNVARAEAEVSDASTELTTVNGTEERAKAEYERLDTISKGLAEEFRLKTEAYNSSALSQEKARLQGELESNATQRGDAQSVFEDAIAALDVAVAKSSPASIVTNLETNKDDADQELTRLNGIKTGLDADMAAIEAQLLTSPEKLAMDTAQGLNEPATAATTAVQSTLDDLAKATLAATNRFTEKTEKVNLANQAVTDAETSITKATNKVNGKRRVLIIPALMLTVAYLLYPSLYGLVLVHG